MKILADTDNYMSHSMKRVPFGSATFDEMHKAPKCAYKA